MGVKGAAHSSCYDTVYDREIIINSNSYTNEIKDEVIINSLEILENEYLKINYSAAGCDGTNREVLLVDSGVFLESSPLQRNLIFSLSDKEESEAFIRKEIFISIKDLKIEGETKCF